VGQGPLKTYITLKYVMGSFSLDSIVLKDCGIVGTDFVNSRRGRGPIIVSRGAPTGYRVEGGSNRLSCRGGLQPVIMSAFKCPSLRASSSVSFVLRLYA
jgi:hypothetical protein